MADLVERAGRRAADPLGRRIGRDELGMGGLEGDEAAEELVVLGVGQLGRVLLVVEGVGATDAIREVGVAGGGRLDVERRRLLDEGRVDGQAVDGLGHPTTSRLARLASMVLRPTAVSRKATTTSSSLRVSFELTTMPSPQRAWRTRSPSRY